MNEKPAFRVLHGQSKSQLSIEKNGDIVLNGEIVGNDKNIAEVFTANEKFWADIGKGWDEVYKKHMSERGVEIKVKDILTEKI